MIGVDRPRWSGGPVDAVFTTQDEVGLPAVAHPRQVHGRQVHRVDGGSAPEEGDGLWTLTPGLAIAVRVADCVPILLWDPEAGAVGAVHAGWRGTAQDIVGAALDLGQTLGVAPGRLRAAIGPSIGPSCYQVGEEVVSGLRGVGLPDEDFLRPERTGRPHVDLRAANRALLVRRGVPSAQIEDVGGCTHCHPDRYPSFRRDGALAGRMRGVIRLVPSLFALLLLCGGPGCEDPPTVEDVAKRADEAHASGHDADVLPVLEAAAQSHPDHAWLRAAWARALRAGGDHHGAMVQGRFAVGLDPSLWQAAYGLAIDAASLGDEDDALRWLQAALQADPQVRILATQDPDLAPLRGDHRFVFFQETGILSRRETDAVLSVEPASVRVGEDAALVLHIIDLNRPILAPRPPVAIVPPPELLTLDLLPVSRAERLLVVENAGREVLQRTVIFVVRPGSPGRLPIGPFQIRHGDHWMWTPSPMLTGVGEATPGDGLPAVWLDRWYRAPSEDDPGALGLLAAAGALREIDPLAAGPVDAPWFALGGELVRAVRFRVTDGSLPASVPAPDPAARRSVLLQRAAEGWSHVVDRRPDDGLRSSDAVPPASASPGPPSRDRSLQ